MIEPTSITVEIRQTKEQAVKDVDQTTCLTIVEWPWPDKVTGKDYQIFRESTKLFATMPDGGPGKAHQAEMMRIVAKHFQKFAKYLDSMS